MAKLRNLTGLGELCKRVDLRPPELDKPELIAQSAIALLDFPRIQPNKMRKGKSGEIKRIGGKGNA